MFFLKIELDMLSEVEFCKIVTYVIWLLCSEVLMSIQPNSITIHRRTVSGFQWKISQARFDVLVVVVTPTNRRKSVSNHCVIELIGVVFLLPLCFFECSIGIEVFVIILNKIFPVLLCVQLHKSILLKERVRRFSVEAKRKEINCVIWRHSW